MLRLTPRADRRLAMRLEDLASALDAGLPADGILADAGGGPLTARLTAAGLALSPAEVRAAEAAEQVGELPRVLRTIAARRTADATLARRLLGRLAYPALLLALSMAAFGLLAAVGNGRVWVALAGPLAIVALVLAVAFFAHRAATDPAFTSSPIPGLRRLSHDVGQTAYLDAMEMLYGAGVGIVEAHDLATKTVRIAWVRLRLAQAGQLLAGGETSLADALGASAALDAETLSLLRPGEMSGELEDALRRAAGRRRDVLQRTATALVVGLGGTVYALTAVWIGWRVLSFYSGYFSMLR